MRRPDVLFGNRASGRWVFGLCSLLALAPLHSPPLLGAQPRSTPEDTQARLEQVRSRIASISKRLEAARAREDVVAHRLRGTEVKAGRAAQELLEMEARLVEERARLADLRRAREERSQVLAEHREALARQIRATYMMGQQDYLRVFLTQEDAAAVGRALTYQRYFNRARAVRIQRVTDDVSRLQEFERAIRLETSALERLKRRKAQARGRLEQLRKERQSTLDELRLDIRRKGQRLERLDKDEKRLEALLKEIRSAFADFSPPQEDGAFASMKGRLPWPVPGSILRKFGTPRPPGHLTWQGVFISAPSGQAVRAVARGRVAFADWLRGFGLLLIIDHGHGYMTLYGHNRTLHKETGDWVDTGEVIAAAGDSGGNDDSGLYFEIRRLGIPENPIKWCSGHPRPAKTALVTR